MSKLAELIAEAQAGLSIQERISEEKWAAIAAQCGATEAAEIRERIALLKAELETIEDWDGDTRDDINVAIYRFTKLLECIAD
ncbi:hypothetical protein [Pseudomonas nitroreducens]|uniref:hypothetical protein n=1 Tax=Pseudomonas nitroreducens TaxID=46680 RepID=UPI00209E34AF|nr:hypothetical protein [Pseudomonas nitroreducens]MCP1623661.1 uncharacterized small protein (DUF1192 family) [Pseudomonas nitroreducens]